MLESALPKHPTRRDVIGGAVLLAAKSRFLNGGYSSNDLADSSSVHILQGNGTITLANDYVRAVFKTTASGVQQSYFARSGDSWAEVVSSLLAPSPRPAGTSPLYCDDQSAASYRLLTANAVRTACVHQKSRLCASAVLSGTNGGNSFEQVVTLTAEAKCFHISIRADLVERKLEYLLSLFTFNFINVDYSHVPHLKRNPADVVGDRSFHCPAIILQKGSLLAALVPDLNVSNTDVVYAPDARQADGPRVSRVWQDPATVSMPKIFDLDHMSGLSPYPVFAFGFADYLAQPHVYWHHPNGDGVMVRRLSQSNLHFAFDLFVCATAEPQHGYQAISRYIWNCYGSPNLQTPKPLVMPLQEYVQPCYTAASTYRGDTPEDTARYLRPSVPIRGSERDRYRAELSGPTPSWLEFEINKAPAGGIRTTPPWGYHDVMFSDLLNNVHLAQGLSWWGAKTNDQELTNKARRIINLTLSAPQQEGIFPGLWFYEQKIWGASYWKPPGEPPDPSRLNKTESSAEFYQTSWASNTAALLMRYDERYEQDPRILPYVQKYGDFIVARTSRQGCLPMWFTQDLAPVDNLRFNAAGGLHMNVLAYLFQRTAQPSYKAAAMRMAEFLISEVLPEQRWYDWETFYSCSPKKEATYDERTGQWPRSTMSMLWAVEGFTAWYELTQDARMLDAAERAADYLGLYQSVWQPEFIVTAYGFGGFVSQNSDAEWLDMRQCRAAEALVRLGLASARKDLLERGVAAMRSGFALTHHERIIRNGVFPHPMYPVGLSPENMDHDGIPQCCLRSGCDWGEGGALASAAELLRQLGSLYIDIDRGIAVGVDGVAVRSFRRRGKFVYLEVANQLADLPLPWVQALQLDLCIKSSEPGTFQLLINKQAPISVSLRGTTRLTFSLPS